MIPWQYREYGDIAVWRMFMAKEPIALVRTTGRGLLPPAEDDMRRYHKLKRAIQKETIRHPPGGLKLKECLIMTTDEESGAETCSVHAT